MRGITLPPKTEDFTADPVELFFDLAFVFAFSQMVGILVHDPDWKHVGQVALLFGLLWLPWQQFTWSANAVAGNSRPVRMFLLAATVASVPMAASIGTAMGDGAELFALSVSAIFLMGLGLMLFAAKPGTTFRPAAIRWGRTNMIAVVLLIAGGFLDDVRVPLWLASIAVIMFSMYQAGKGEWLVRPGHMAERHGLLVIIALGEIIVAIGIPVVDALSESGGVPAETVAVLAAAGAFAALLWWGYFDRISPALEHFGEELSMAERGRFVRDVYTWGHAPIVAGIIFAAAALEELALHPGDSPDTAIRYMLLGGMVAIFGGVAGGIYRAFAVIPPERAAAMVVIASVVALGGSLSGLALVLIVDAILLITLVVENQRIEHAGS